MNIQTAKIQKSRIKNNQRQNWAPYRFYTNSPCDLQIRTLPLSYYFKFIHFVPIFMFFLWPLNNSQAPYNFKYSSMKQQPQLSLLENEFMNKCRKHSQEKPCAYKNLLCIKCIDDIGMHHEHHEHCYTSINNFMDLKSIYTEAESHQRQSLRKELEILRMEMNQGLDDLENCLLGKTKLDVNISVEEFSFEVQRKIWKYLHHRKSNNNDEIDKNIIYELQNRFSSIKEPIRLLSNDFKEAIMRINQYFSRSKDNLEVDERIEEKVSKIEGPGLAQTSLKKQSVNSIKEPKTQKQKPKKEKKIQKPKKKGLAQSDKRKIVMKIGKISNNQLSKLYNVSLFTIRQLKSEYCDDHITQKQEHQSSASNQSLILMD